MLRRLAIRAVQLLSAWLVRLFYSLSIEGGAHVPAAGPALLVANHVTFIDAMLIGAAVGRPPRFVVSARYYRSALIGPLFRLTRAIPIASRRDEPELAARAYEAIDAALAAGELVVIFPEGRLTTDGELGAFRPGALRVLDRRPVPVVPVALSGLWGSFWSMCGGRAFAGSFRGFRSRVAVALGAPLEPRGLSPDALRGAVAALRTAP